MMNSPVAQTQVPSSEPITFPPGVAFRAGRYVPISDAHISVLDWGFLHSDATYDTVHVWDGRFFRLDLHIDRFFESMRQLRLSPGYTRDEVRGILVECVRRSGHRNAYVDMICTRGISPTFSRDPREAVNQFIAFALPFNSVASERQLRDGLSVAIIDRWRLPPRTVPSEVKNFHWIDLVTALFEGYDREAETVLVRDFEGNIAEGPGFNIFVVREGTLLTPAKNILPGITRRTVMDICNLIGRGVELGVVSDADLLGADEIFITSTAGGVMPVTRVDGIAIGTGEVGPITRELMKIYWELHRDPAWTVEVNY